MTTNIFTGKKGRDQSDIIGGQKMPGGIRVIIPILICFSLFPISCKKKEQKDQLKTSSQMHIPKYEFSTQKRDGSIAKVIVDLKVKDMQIDSEGKIFFWRVESFNDGKIKEILLKESDNQANSAPGKDDEITYESIMLRPGNIIGFRSEDGNMLPFLALADFKQDTISKHFQLPNLFGGPNDVEGETPYYQITRGQNGFHIEGRAWVLWRDSEPSFKLFQKGDVMDIDPAIDTYDTFYYNGEKIQLHGKGRLFIIGFGSGGTKPSNMLARWTKG